MKFSIITVSYNAGDKLRETLESVAAQTCTDYEVIVKDGGSTDGSTEFLREMGSVGAVGRTGGENREKTEEARWREMLAHVRLVEGKDAGIYDAMNQAVTQAKGEFILFLNCGDLLADREVLSRTWEAVEAAGDWRGADKAETGKRFVIYGDTFSRKTGVTIASPPRVTGFTCYRNIPCHQSCFYSAALCREKPFDLQYRIRADYDHFLWCFYQGRAEFIYLGFPVSSYEGGGYSESRENAERDRREHRQITSCYMGKGELLRYHGIMALTLAPLRRRMADSRVFSGVYHGIKDAIYKRKDRL